MGENDPSPAPAAIGLGDQPDFVLGGLAVHPSDRTIELGGRRDEIQPRVMQVLVALAEARPGVVSRDRLIERCWDGRIVGDDAINRCIVALRHVAQSFDPPPFAIETIPRVGYRLVETASATAPVPRQPPARRRGVFAAFGAVALSLVALVAWQSQSTAREPASIAVVPFRTLSAGNTYLADGVSEDVLGYLAREPAFRVTGRNAAAQFEEPADPREVGRAFGVDYVLEGSVRQAGDRVRVNASLVQTSDGIRLWSQTYDRRIDDMLTIQENIGRSVAGALKRELTGESAVPAVNGEAYAVYLEARGLMRSGNPQSAPEAVGLLRKAVSIEPDFALGWARLADALRIAGRNDGPDGLISVLPEAQAATRRALAIDPDLAEAHAALAILLDIESPAGIAQMRRAAELRSGTAEGWQWLATVRSSEGNADGVLAALLKAQSTDPLWPIPPQALIDTYAARGERAKAEQIADRAFADDPVTRDYAYARIASIVGDYSTAIARWSRVAGTSSRWARPAETSLNDVRYTLGLSTFRPPPLVLANVIHQRPTPRLWMDHAPDSETWKSRNRSSAAGLVYRPENEVGAKLMLGERRFAELAATYDNPSGLLGIVRGRPVSIGQLAQAPLVALALRGAGRTQEADQVLDSAASAITRAQRSKNAVLWFYPDAAGVWAVKGRHDLALAALERAVGRGWLHAWRTDLPRLEDEPAFHALRAEPRFQAILRRLEARLARERDESRSIPLPSRPPQEA